MRIHLNLLHVIATVVPILISAAGAPWYICLPVFMVLISAATRLTKFHDDLEASDEG